ncbi:MAG: hypothetical protein GC185_13930 [Alphaproteobacteria bacterium]|nr:hypothetical protein [Alphaproteobacteria bacterium]
MTTEAFVGNIFFERGDDASPTAYTRVCQIFSIGGVGETNDLVDVTTFCSGGNREYVPGLADGEEVTIEGNYEFGATIYASMIADVKLKANRSYRIVIEDKSQSPVAKRNLLFDGSPKSWLLGPSVDDKNTISFTIKISGEVTIEDE